MNNEGLWGETSHLYPMRFRGQETTFQRFMHKICKGHWKYLINDPDHSEGVLARVAAQLRECSEAHMVRMCRAHHTRHGIRDFKRITRAKYVDLPVPPYRGDKSSCCRCRRCYRYDRNDRLYIPREAAARAWKMLPYIPRLAKNHSSDIGEVRTKSGLNSAQHNSGDFLWGRALS
jgi:hypothetical protein